MRRQGKFGILAVCLLIVGLLTGNILPSTQTRAVGICPIPATNPAVDANQASSALSELNSVRTSALLTTTTGTVTPATLSAVTSATNTAAQNHATYLANNPSEFGNNFEVNSGSATSCFTTAGNAAAGNALRVANVASLSEAVDAAIDSIYLRLPLLDPRLQSVGLGFDTSFGVIDPSNSSSPGNMSPTLVAGQARYLVGYPGPNAVGVPPANSASYLPGEGITQTITAAYKPRLLGGLSSNGTTRTGVYGDPFTGSSTASSVVGYPISLSYDATTFGTVAVSTSNSSLVEVSTNNSVGFTIKQPTEVMAVYNSVWSVSPSTPLPTAAVLVPGNILKANTQYRVTFNYTASLIASGATQTISWTFTTGNDTSGSTTPGTGTPGTAGPTPTTGGSSGIPQPTLYPLPTSSLQTPTPTAGLPGVPVVPPTVGPTSFYQPTPANGSNPPQFFQVWRRVDDPVKNGLVNRSWVYGPLPYGFSILNEFYDGTSRTVAYHDKARMEFRGNGVTNGLLVREMISGALQLGDSKFDFRTPALQTVAGDPYELNPTAPTYFSFSKIASLNNDNRSASAIGQPVIATLAPDGTLGANYGVAAYGVTNVYYSSSLGHNIPNRFWEFMNQSGLVLDGGYFTGRVLDWVQVMGLPLSEPYWTIAQVNGQARDVLVQVFERRVLTFTPANSPAFQVEMGNVGRAYYKWRYGR